MRVVILIQRAWQNAGREELLRVGGHYDLPEAVAVPLIATGAAEAEVPPVTAAPEQREDSRREVKPFRPAETKARAG